MPNQAVVDVRFETGRWCIDCQVHSLLSALAVRKAADVLAFAVIKPAAHAELSPQCPQGAALVVGKIGHDQQGYCVTHRGKFAQCAVAKVSGNQAAGKPGGALVD